MQTVWYQYIFPSFSRSSLWQRPPCQPNTTTRYHCFSWLRHGNIPTLGKLRMVDTGQVWTGKSPGVLLLYNFTGAEQKRPLYIHTYSMLYAAWYMWPLVHCLIGYAPVVNMSKCYSGKGLLWNVLLRWYFRVASSGYNRKTVSWHLTVSLSYQRYIPCGNFEITELSSGFQRLFMYLR